jgi:hypothetical protein
MKFESKKQLFKMITHKKIIASKILKKFIDYVNSSNNILLTTKTK